MNTLALIKAFLTAYFVEHDSKKGLALVTEDVRGYGFVDNQEISGLADLKKMAATDAYISFRVLDGNGKSKWMNASFTRHGEKNGLPVILVLFTASTIQNDLQLHTLSQNGIGIAVIDANTHELYFVNDAMSHMLGKEPCDYIGRLCSEVLMGCGGSCKDCKMQNIKNQTELDQTVEINGKWLAFHQQ